MANSFTSNSDMKRFIHTALFIVIGTFAWLIANDFINQYLFLTSTNTASYKICRLFGKVTRGNNEIPILGSSRAVTGFVSSELSPRAFNYGIPSSMQNETLLHLKIVSKRDDVNLVLVNLDPWGISANENGFQGDYSLVYSSPFLKGCDNIGQVSFGDRCLGLRFYGKLRSNLSSYINAHFSTTQKIDRGTILMLTGRNKAEWNYMIARSTDSQINFSINQNTWQEYKQVISDNTNINIVFVLSPITSCWWEMFTGKEKLQAFLQEFSQFPNVTVIDLCSTNVDKYDLTHFSDLIHLNEKGAMRFSRELRVTLESLGLL